MNFFFDENFPKNCQHFLEELGHKVFDIRLTLQEGLDDVSIFKLAQEKSAIFITSDKDFFHTIPHHFSTHKGILVFTLSKPNRVEFLEKLKWVIENLDIEDLSNKVILLKDKNYFIKN